MSHDSPSPAWPPDHSAMAALITVPSQWLQACICHGICSYSEFWSSDRVVMPVLARTEGFMPDQQFFPSCSLFLHIQSQSGFHHPLINFRRVFPVIDNIWQVSKVTKYYKWVLLPSVKMLQKCQPQGYGCCHINNATNLISPHHQSSNKWWVTNNVIYKPELHWVTYWVLPHTHTRMFAAVMS